MLHTHYFNGETPLCDTSFVGTVFIYAGVTIEGKKR